MKDTNVQIVSLSPRRWAEYRGLALEAVRTDPLAFPETRAELDGLLLSRWRRQLDESLEGRSRRIFFAESEGCLVGVGVMTRFLESRVRHNVRLGGLYVAPGFRRRGIGRRLVEARIAAAVREWGAINLYCRIFSGQEAVIALHEQLGFVHSGTIVGYLRDGDTSIDEYTYVKRV